MSQPIRYLLDEHMPSHIVEGLARQSIETSNFQQLGRDGLKDFEQLQYADSEGWIIVTYDRDFLRLHDRDPLHAGIIWWKLGKYSYSQVIQWLGQYHHHFDMDDFRNQHIHL